MNMRVHIDHARDNSAGQRLAVLLAAGPNVGNHAVAIHRQGDVAAPALGQQHVGTIKFSLVHGDQFCKHSTICSSTLMTGPALSSSQRSEERRVGKECRVCWWPACVVETYL